VISGSTRLIAHVGFPTEGFRSPQIYNPWFEQRGIDAVVVPMGVARADWPALIRPLFSMRNLIGALVTMPLKVDTATLVDEISLTARIAGACNAVRRGADGQLMGDMFDGEGFLRGLRRKGQAVAGARGLVVGCGGVGSAIAAALAAGGVAALRLHDVRDGSAAALAERLRLHYPALAASTDAPDLTGCDIVVNATPLGMAEGDALPLDPALLQPGCMVGDVVMREHHTPLLRAALARGCRVQVGTDMLFEQIPAYLEYFGLGTADSASLRAVARIGP
jgi:shikimate dehydrogenase